MSRCIACNAILTKFELTDKDEEGDYYDICSNCRKGSKVEEDYVEDHQYIVPESMLPINLPRSVTPQSDDGCRGVDKVKDNFF